MFCPRCKGKTKVTDTISKFEKGKVYRRRQCYTCILSLNTVETVEGFDVSMSSSHYLNGTKRDKNANNKQS